MCENDGHKQRAYSAISVAQQPTMPADNCQVFSSALLPPVHALSCLQRKAAGYLPSKSCPSYQQGSTTSLAMLILQADQRGCVLVLLRCQSASTCCGLHVLWSAAPPLNLFVVIAHASAAAVTAMAWFLVHVECPSPDRWGTPSHRRHGSGDTCWT